MWGAVQKFANKPVEQCVNHKDPRQRSYGGVLSVTLDHDLRNADLNPATDIVILCMFTEKTTCDILDKRELSRHRTDDFDTASELGYKRDSIGRRLEVPRPDPPKPKHPGSRVLTEDAVSFAWRFCPPVIFFLFRYQRHKKLVNDYLQYYGGSRKDFQRDTSKDKRDVDVIREHNRFLWTEADVPRTWYVSQFFHVN
ncbi:unnamed protein product [Dibothriocephalus latus]|uniref:Uncharacterized protein n=1 Tax=Dibothriocephalus latus TaxID=60516 RepID=A0A3P7P3A3_DIBLA|nr:unnamed protein product [Dibothriocephalus latus]